MPWTALKQNCDKTWHAITRNSTSKKVFCTQCARQSVRLGTWCHPRVTPALTSAAHWPGHFSERQFSSTVVGSTTHWPVLFSEAGSLVQPTNSMQLYKCTVLKNMPKSWFALHLCTMCCRKVWLVVLNAISKIQQCSAQRQYAWWPAWSGQPCLILHVLLYCPLSAAQSRQQTVHTEQPTQNSFFFSRHCNGKPWPGRKEGIRPIKYRYLIGLYTEYCSPNGRFLFSNHINEERHEGKEA